MFSDLVEVTEDQRRNFFKLLFGQATGYVCISYLPHIDRKMVKRFFAFPGELDEMLENIQAHSQQLVHAYFCPNLYRVPGDKSKEYVGVCTNVWADLDTCDPRHMLLTPSIITQTSQGRYQAMWLLEDHLPPAEAEDISRRIAYYHSDQGADKSGWDLSQLLRIPYTPNFKYGDIQTAPVVTILESKRRLYRAQDFDCYPVPNALKFTIDKTPPKDLPSDETAEQIVTRLNDSKIDELFYTRPPEGEDWSGKSWQLIQLCEEAQLSRDKAFIVANAAACNKYRRDNRPETDLWHEVNKIYVKHIERMKLAPTASATVPELITDEEIQLVHKRKTFIEKYIDWASGLTDASVQYHQAGAFVILSSLLAGAVRLPTSFGTIIPNLWFMILGPTTVTRKSVAMNISMKLLYDVNEEALLATDGSLEGILVGMRDRPGQPSIFLRDEFTGLLEAIAHKDYMAGFAEQLTKLYDGEPLKRLLRKETIDIRDPVFIMFVGGIKTKTQNMLTEELVMGGFLPRFIMITAEPDLSRIRPIGPPVEAKTEERELLKNELLDLYNHYTSEKKITRNGESIGRVAPVYNAELTPEAWKRYNEFETLLTSTALDAGLEYLMPVNDRLAKSTLKAAVLIAACTQRGDSNRVVVTMQDLLHAIYYAKNWREYGSEIVNNLGKSGDERLLDKIVQFVRGSADGSSRGEIMNVFRLDAKRADLLLKTMEQRQMLLTVEINGERRLVSNE